MIRRLLRSLASSGFTLSVFHRYHVLADTHAAFAASFGPPKCSSMIPILSCRFTALSPIISLKVISTLCRYKAAKLTTILHLVEFGCQVINLKFHRVSFEFYTRCSMLHKCEFYFYSGD